MSANTESHCDDCDKRDDHGGKFRPTRDAVAHTHRSLESLKPDAKAYRVPDLRCPGLAIRVATSGGRTWDLAFLVRGTGKYRRLSLGPFPAVSLDQARERANALTRAAQAGRDLIAEETRTKVEAEARVTVGAIVDEFIKRKVIGKLRTAHDIERRLRRTLAPLKDRAASEVTRRDIRTIVERVADRGALREAEKQRQMITTLFRWAVGRELMESNPALGLETFSSGERRNRILSADEIRIFWHWLDRDAPFPTADYSDALKLQLALGCRIGEAAGLDAAEVDQASWVWTLPAARSKNGRPRVTPLVGIAREIVETRLKRVKSGPLFLADINGGVLQTNHVASAFVKRRKTCPIEHFVTHDLRRTVATALVDLGIGYELTSAVLGHEGGGKNVRTLLAHYVRSDQLDRKRLALQAWDARLRQLISGNAAASNVTSIGGLKAIA